MEATLEYHKVLERILKEGTKKENRTGIDTVSIFSHTMEFDMADGFPMITTKKMFTKGIFGELLWFLRGSRDIQELWEHNIKIWDGNWYDQYSKGTSSPYTLEEIKEKVKSGSHSFHDSMFSLGPIYGKQWVSWTNKVEMLGSREGVVIVNKNINQIENAIDALKNGPDSRRIMVTAWNPAEIAGMALPPCHWAFELYTDELTLVERLEVAEKSGKFELLDCISKNTCDTKGIPTRKLHLKWHQRSVDTFLGLPFNITSYAFLLEMLAQQVNMVPGKLIGDLTNVHLYENHLELVEEQLGRNASKHKAPTIKLKKAKDIFSYSIDDFEILNYTSYPNWKDVPMAV